MTHTVRVYNQHVSARLSRILDNRGYSYQDRDRKVRIAKETELFRNISNTFTKNGHRMYLFGSRGEGSTGPELQSDFDILQQFDDFNAITDVKDCQPGKTNYLLVKDDFTHPGYVKLQVIYMFPDNTPFPICTFIKLIPDNVLKRKGFACDAFNRFVLSHDFIHHLGVKISGPAVEYPSDYFKEFSTDWVFALRCSQWPREGYEWFQRRRLHGWPSPQQIENAWEYGCFATAVGHPHSHEQYIEWRLSFSIAERELTRSFEDTVMKVYILLKIIKKTFIEPVVGDAFSSYHCKVCMLWMREKTPPEMWRNENILPCLILCIRQLYEWASAGNCPDYFIVTNNVYDRKIFGKVRCLLVKQFGYLLSTDGRALLEIQCCSIGHRLAHELSMFDINIHFSSMFSFAFDIYSEECTIIYGTSKCRYTILKDIPQCYPTLVGYLNRLEYSSRYLPYDMQYPVKFTTMVLRSQLGFHIATVCKEKAHLLSQEQIDYLVTLAYDHLSHGISSDATSIRLKLCGLGIEIGNYDFTEVCLQGISDYRMRYTYSVTNRKMQILQSNMISSAFKRITNIYNAEELMTTHVSFSVVFMPLEISITPKPLRIEMFRSIGLPQILRERSCYSGNDWAVVDSFVCLHFFQFLNFASQGKERHMQVAMENMIHVIRTEENIFHRDTALNLLGHSFIQKSQFANAFICFIQSLKMNSYYNAARLHLAILFRRVRSTYRRHVRYGNRTIEIGSLNNITLRDNTFSFVGSNAQIQTNIVS